MRAVLRKIVDSKTLFITVGVLVLASVGIYFTEVFFTLPSATIEILDTIQRVITGLFIIELAVRMADRPFYRDWWIDLIAVIDIITPAVKIFKSLRMIRSVRMVRSLRLIKFNKQKQYTPKIQICNNIATVLILSLIAMQVYLAHVLFVNLPDETLRHFEGFFFIASLVIVAVTLAALNLNLDRGFDKPLKSFLISQITLLEAKDAYTAGHSITVAESSAVIGRAFGLAGANLRNLFLAGLIHDIGKIGVKDSILNNPGHLSDDEFNQIKKHTEYSERSLHLIDRLIPEPVYRACVEHHEHPDGTGYPKGLLEKDIHFFSRIIAVADTFDALFSRRSYQGPVSPDEAFRRLESDERRGQPVIGSQLDPEVYRVAKALVLRGLGREIDGTSLPEKSYKKIIREDLKISVDPDVRHSAAEYANLSEPVRENRLAGRFSRLFGGKRRSE